MLIVWWFLLGWLIDLRIDNRVKDAVRLADVARFFEKPQKNSLIRQPADRNQIVRGAIVRGDTTKRRLAIVFTGDEYADGGKIIRQALNRHQVRASFFLTGRFYRNPVFQSLIRQLKQDGHYLGAHSDAHLLYCDWTRRDSLLVSETQFRTDLDRNYAVMQSFGIRKKDARFFLPPYEWYNDTIAAWTQKAGLQLINYTPGTLSHADYTTPDLRNYRSSQVILQSIYDYEQRQPSGLNGFILLLHIGTHSDRTDKLYRYLDELLDQLQRKGYEFVKIDALIG
ncbi:polysaccharide deacetylase family protein [Larkinella sp. VNQ87]|uniref:polysaccharide deacetylase family protein n=1 Tax=Larkinella sp. VNQ87 TaxID=3400921 RepID=UPI003C0D03A6